MIEVKPIEVNLFIPEDNVRIVAMQPFIRLHPERREPFQWSNDAIEAQMTAINKTLDIAVQNYSDHSTRFTIFPEYAIPGIDGVSAINDRVCSDPWPKDSVIIAGIHGIQKEEYRQICNRFDAIVNGTNSPNSVLDHQWVNCCITWVKDHDGMVRMWIQPKIRPSWPEMNILCNDMFCGSGVYVFESKFHPSGFPCKFATLICYDWIVNVAGRTVYQELLDGLSELRKPALTPLDMIFVIQHNPNPNHVSFLNSTKGFLTDVRYPFVDRCKAVVLHMNTAAAEEPTRKGERGFSSCVFSPSTPFDLKGCIPTVCMQPSSPVIRKALERCKDVVFREMGECIHVFDICVPRFVSDTAGGRTLPLQRAHVHATIQSVDPRLPGGPVPAAVKWFNDSLDDVERLSKAVLETCSLKSDAIRIEALIIDNLRNSDGEKISKSINWATCSFSEGIEYRNEDRRSSADFWESEEDQALEHLLHSLTSVGIVYDLELKDTALHCAIQVNDLIIQIVAIRGATHNDCRRHFESHVKYLGIDPVLVIANDNRNLRPTDEEYLKLNEVKGLESFVFIDYSTLIKKCRNASNKDMLKEYFNHVLPRKDTRII